MYVLQTFAEHIVTMFFFFHIHLDKVFFAAILCSILCAISLSEWLMRKINSEKSIQMETHLHAKDTFELLLHDLLDYWPI